MAKDLFANDGSFMERFKQMQKEMEEKSNPVSSKPPVSSAPPVPAKPSLVLHKRPLEQKGSFIKKTDRSTGASTGATGKLAFSLKSKSKVVTAPAGFGVDEEDDDEGGNEEFLQDPAKRVKPNQEPSSGHGAVAETGVPSPPSDYTVRKVIDKLANLVAKNGRQHEHITRQRNPGDTPFKFLFDKNCSEYKYYEHRLHEEEKALALLDSGAASSHHGNITSAAGWSGGSQRGMPQQKYQTPSAALYGSNQEAGSSGSASGPPSDPVAMMEFFMKKAAAEEKKRPPRLSKDEMPPPPSLQASGSGKKGHHMGDFIPQEELEKFMARCNDAAATKAAKEAAEKAKIQADNIGHKLLSKMGWREGEGLGSDRSGRSDPVMAGDVKKDNLGVGAVKPGEVSSEDDIYEQYKKRMMLGYKHRPNPLNNPRKAYY